MNVPQVNSTSIDAQVRTRPRQPAVQAGVTGSSPATESPRSAPATDAVKPQSADAANGNSTVEQVKAAVKELNRAMQHSNRALEFSVDDDTDRVVVRLKDGATGETIRQIPSEETLAIARYIADVQQGLLLSQKA
ncbi:MAG: flagellar protein FlaG [Sulfuritalea sp.]|jgi:flagellar protein FlaG|nr:flagellar protein FlaG [Sulfuritalea sp.]MBK8762274.1 flagellar protein FlaG [Sulfuritalea sp.]MBK9348790.1 flagellar protein FlaG [Sulfuritalea sp.]MBP7422885.1 flagellar protein FlaG [Sulfuritalea sp.]